MKTLYQPVFWCGFALSITALYGSSERFSAAQSGELKTVPMSIFPDGSATNRLDLGVSRDFAIENSPADLGHENMPPTEEGLWKVRAAGFLADAEEALK